MKVLVTIPDGQNKREFLTSEVLELLEGRFDVEYNTLGRDYTADELRERIKDKDIVLGTWGSPSFRNDMCEGSNVKLIAHTAGSVGDLVDETVYNRGIKVISGNRMYAESVAEGTLAYMMIMLRRLPDEIASTKAGGWYNNELYYTEGLFDRTVGIVGYGMISQCVMRLLKPFRVKIKLYSAHPVPKEFLDEVGAEQCSLEEVFSKSSVISLHSSLTPKNVGIIGREHFRLMKDGAIFINTSRGAIVRESEMIEELADGRIRAVLDVFDPEPPALDNPLRNMKNVYVISHKAGPTTDRRPYIGRAIVEDLIAFSEGRELKHEITLSQSSRMTRHSMVRTI